MQSAQVFPEGKLARGLGERRTVGKEAVKLEVVGQSAQVFPEGKTC